MTIRIVGIIIYIIYQLNKLPVPVPLVFLTLFLKKTQINFTNVYLA